MVLRWYCSSDDEPFRVAGVGDDEPFRDAGVGDDEPSRVAGIGYAARGAVAGGAGEQQLARGAVLACPSSLGSIGGHVAGRARASSAACRWMQAGVAAQEGCVRGRLCSSSMSSSMWSKTH